MGVQGLSDIIKYSREVSLHEFKGYTFAIDAMVQLNRTFKGKVVLTNKAGEKTHHIKSLLSLILKLESYGIKQIWVFDYDTSVRGDYKEHYKYKMATLEKRKEVKEKNKKRLNEAQNKIDDIESKVANMSAEEKEMLKDILGSDGNELGLLKKELMVMQKRVDTPHRKEINDLKFMLDQLGIEWVEAPCTYEAEAICADLVKNGVADYAFTPDLDALLFGANNIIKRSDKGKDAKFYLYNLDEIFEKLKITRTDLIKIGICLGTDANVDGIKFIGTKTVLNKYKNAANWNANPYADIVSMFNRDYDVTELEFHNNNTTSFSSQQQKNLIDWLVEKQTFNRDAVVKQFTNSISSIKIGDIVNKTPVIEFKLDKAFM